MIPPLLLLHGMSDCRSFLLFLGFSPSESDDDDDSSPPDSLPLRPRSPRLSMAGLRASSLTIRLCAGPFPLFLGSVAEVQFRTDPENQNRQNRTENSVLFCSGSLSSLPCSVFGSLKFQIIRTGSKPVRTELNRPTLAI